MNLKQQKVMQLVGNGWNLTKAMREAGYSESYIRNNQKLKRTKSWNLLTDESFPSDETILCIHKSLLEATKLYKMGDEIMTIPDNKVILKALDMAYKLKGYYKTSSSNVEVRDEYESLSDEDLDRILLEHYRKRGII